jgi:hypothetical protein
METTVDITMSFTICILLTSYYQDDKIKKDEIGRICSTHGQIRNVNKISVSKPEGKRLLWRSRHRWEDNIHMGFIGNIVLNEFDSRWDQEGCLLITTP